ncbi:transcription initiation factor TFIID component TAF4 family-domain-containing protein [Phlyctochytrium arcticum]|nr:transcription initiation factor TFIID component TAF4 family-domain-containing protein [Phlyctochytrium arcticum]
MNGNTEDTSFLDILADVADHERPLKVENKTNGDRGEQTSEGVGSGSVQGNYKREDSGASAIQVDTTDEDLMSLFPAHPPELPVDEIMEHPPVPLTETEEQELAALFADHPPHTLAPSLPSSGGGSDPGSFPIDFHVSTAAHQPPPNIRTHSSAAATAIKAPSVHCPSSTLASLPTPAGGVRPPVRPMQRSNSNLANPPPPHIPIIPNLAPRPSPSPQTPQSKATNSFRPANSAPPARPTNPSLPITSAPPPPLGSSPGPTQLLQNLLKQVHPDRHPEFLDLYRQLQMKQLNNEQFLDRAKEMLTVSSRTVNLPIMSRTPSSSGLLRLPLNSPSASVAPALDDMRKRQAESIYNMNPAKRPRPEPIQSGRVSMQMNRGPSTPGTPTHTVMSPGPMSGSFTYRPQNTPAYNANNRVNNAPFTPAPAPRAPAEIDPTKLDVQSMMDVTSYTGVNIREEEDNIMSLMPMTGGYQYGASRVKSQSFLNIAALRRKIELIARKHKLVRVEEDLLNYIALATEERMRDIMDQTVLAAKHRTGLLHETFIDEERERLEKHRSGLPGGEDALELIVVKKDDVRKQLTTLERRERDEERKIRSKRNLGENGEPISEGGAAAEGGTVGGAKTGGVGGRDPEGATPKKKKKSAKDKDMPEEIKMKLANQAVMAAIGGTPMKSWMLGGAGKGGATPGSAGGGSGGATGSSSGGGGTNSGNVGSTSSPLLRTSTSSSRRKSKGDGLTPLPPGYSTTTASRLPGAGRRNAASDQAMRRVTLKDVLFTLENDMTMTKSPLIAKWWPNVT